MDILDEESPFAGAYYSQDFEWEALRNEVESMPAFLEQHGNSKDELREMQPQHKTDNTRIALSPMTKEAMGAMYNPGEEPSTSTAWEVFHTRHSRNIFFKERRYLTKEFPDLRHTDRPLRVLEVGCGTGSSLVPILRANNESVLYACDCSAAALKKAVEVVSTIIESPSGLSFYPFLCDISLEDLPSFICCSACRLQYCQPKKICPELLVGKTLITADEQGDSASTDATGFDTKRSENSKFLSGQSCCIGGVDIVTMIFTLSAIPVEKMAHVLSECLAVLKPGGLLLFRDYGLYDMTMLRFARRQRISDRLYRREDGTLAYFFSLEVVKELFKEAGFVEQELEYCCVRLMNRRKQTPMKRVWIHAKFQKSKA